MPNSKKKIQHLYIILFCIIFAIFFRSYNINYDNFWFDEILSFWIADPEISFQESFVRHKDIEQIPYLYHFLLKLGFETFSYDIYLGRYSSLIFNLMGILFSTLICKKISDNKSYLLALFLFSTNIFLINYSQELRPYSMVFFLCSLNLYIFLKIYKSPPNQGYNFFAIIFMTISNILMIISHPFNLIIFISTSFFLGFSLLNNQKNLKILIYSFFLSFIFSLIYLFILLKNLESFPSWITQPEIKFYTNFYFSKFFGSRLMGLTHLIILLSLVMLAFNKLKKELFNLNIFIIIIFLSYFLPIIYGYLFRPIIFPRYIIFVLIPVIILLSTLTYQIRSEPIRKFVIFLIIIMNIGNHFSESTFQQLYSEKPHYKPNLKKVINALINNNEKFYTIDMSVDENKRNSAYQAINNYISNFDIFEKSEIKYISIENFFNSDKKRIWILCLPDVVFDRCKRISSNPYYKIINKKNIPGVKLILVEKLT